MNVEKAIKAGPPQGRKHQRPYGQIGNVMVVHHVKVNDVRPCFEHGVDFLTKPGEVSGQNGGRNPRLHGFLPS